MRGEGREIFKIGSLFDGIGGFPKSASKFGIIPVWASEIEPWPIKVTQKYFPDMKHLGDITKINGADIEPVDIITFGSPCQDMSVAGKRAGLEGERSGLFMEAIRIIREMRITTGRKYPRFIIWENVPGAYSSNSGQDFRAVLEEIAETEIPMPASGKWAEAGMVRTERVDVAWRTLDAQYWGVPQRRKRIFLVADFGGQCAGEVLFVEPRLPWNSKTSGKEEQTTAGNAGDGVETTVCDLIAGTLDAHYYKGPGMRAGTERTFVAQAIGINGRQDPCCYGEKFSNYQEDAVAATQRACVAKQTDVDLIIESRINSTPEGISEAVSSKWAKGTGGPAGDECYNLVVDKQLLFENHSQDTRYTGPLDVSPIVSATFGMGGNNQPFVVQLNGDRNNPGVSVSEKAFCIPANPMSDRGQAVATKYAVRRLTPLECLRLQGYPDWWLDIEGMSDSAKYKSIGNSIAVPCVDFVMGGIAEVLRDT